MGYSLCTIFEPKYGFCMVYSLWKMADFQNALNIFRMDFAMSFGILIFEPK